MRARAIVGVGVSTALIFLAVSTIGSTGASAAAHHHRSDSLTSSPRLTALAAPARTGRRAAAGSISVSGPLAEPIHQIALHASYQALLPRQKSQPRGVHYARGHKPKGAGSSSAACSEPRCPLTFHGGRVQHSPKVYLLLWGPGWSSTGSDTTYLRKFLGGLGTQPTDTWSTSMEQYTDSTGHPSFSGSVLQGTWQDTTTPPHGLTQSQLSAEADAFYSNRGLTDHVNSQVVIATPSGNCPQGFYALSCSSGSGSYCAWHSQSTRNGVPYTNLPYLPDAGYGCGQGNVNSPGTYDGFSIVEGHEFGETVTDPFPDTGWIDNNDPTGGENGDKCAWTNDGNVTFSTGTFAMQPLWSNSSNACVKSASGTTRMEETAVSLDGWAWSKDTTGNFRVSSVPASTSQFTFSGTSLKWLTKQGPGYGRASVTIDGAAKGTFDLYGTALRSYTVSFSGLSSGAHKLVIKVLGTKRAASTDDKVAVDGFTVGTTTTQENSTSVLYDSWKGVATATASGGAYRVASAAGRTASLRFTGTGVDWITYTGPGWGQAQVLIDGVSKGTVDLYASTSRPQSALAYRGLAAGSHTITIKVLGTKNPAATSTTAVPIDAFVIH
jgi:hypothetical protein